MTEGTSDEGNDPERNLDSTLAQCMPRFECDVHVPRCTVNKYGYPGTSRNSNVSAKERRSFEDGSGLVTEASLTGECKSLLSCCRWRSGKRNGECRLQFMEIVGVLRVSGDGRWTMYTSFHAAGRPCQMSSVSSTVVRLVELAVPT